MRSAFRKKIRNCNRRPRPNCNIFSQWTMIQLLRPSATVAFSATKCFKFDSYTMPPRCPHESGRPGRFLIFWRNVVYRCAAPGENNANIRNYVILSSSPETFSLRKLAFTQTIPNTTIRALSTKTKIIFHYWRKSILLIENFGWKYMHSSKCRYIDIYYFACKQMGYRMVAANWSLKEHCTRHYRQ